MKYLIFSSTEIISQLNLPDFLFAYQHGKVATPQILVTCDLESWRPRQVYSGLFPMERYVMSGGSGPSMNGDNSLVPEQ
jgi:hypothetical protein